MAGNSDSKPEVIPYENLDLTGARVLLAGGGGFIGHHLALELREKGAEVMIADHLQINNLVKIVSDPSLDETRRKLYTNFVLDRFELLRDAGVHMVNVDLRGLSDFAAAHDEFEPTKIVHLAAISSAVIANKTPGLAYDLQITSLRNLLELCRLRGTKVDRVAFMSSSTVYGDFETDEVDETVRPQPRGVYANGKYIGERMLREAWTLYNTPYSIIRPSALYGIRCVSGRVSQKFVENALMGIPLRLEGGGGGLLDFTDVRDVVRGIILALALPEGKSRTFNITYGNAQPVRALVDIIREFVPKVQVEEAPAAKEKPKRGTLRIERAREFLGFEPQYHITKGYREYVEWYVDQWQRAGFGNKQQT